MRVLRHLILGSAALVISGCTIGGNDAQPPQDDLLVTDGGPDRAVVDGFTNDPEAFMLSVITWPCEQQDCSDAPPPLEFSPIPHTARSYVSGVTGRVLSTDAFADVGTQSAPSDQTGTWEVDNVPRTSVFYTGANVAADAALVPWGPPDFPFPVYPPTKYYPTVTAHAFDPTQSNFCTLIETGVIGNNGVLEAAADTLGGSPDDFVDPTKYDGVIVAWGYPAGPVFLRAPAFGNTFDVTGVDPANVQVMSWAPPGSFPGQSGRGFFTADPSSSAGVYVIPIPKGTNAPVTLTMIPGDGSPAPDPITVTAQPGVVTYVPLQWVDLEGMPPVFCVAPTAAPPPAGP